MKITNHRSTNTIKNYSSTKSSSGRSNRKKVTHRKATKKSSKKRSTVGSDFAHFMRDEKMIKIYGVILVAFALLLFTSLLSYIFTHAADDFHVNSSSAAPPKNIARTVGAHLAYYFTNYTYGIAALGFVFLFFIWGLKLIGIELGKKEKKLSLFKVTISTLLTMSWISLILGFIVIDSTTEFIAGNFGIFSSKYLLEHTGKFVTFLIVTVLFFTILILCYKFSIKKIFLFIGYLFEKLFSGIKQLFISRKTRTQNSKIAKNTSKEESSISSGRQELPGLYLEERNGLNSGMDGQSIDFETNLSNSPSDNDEEDDELINQNDKISQTKNADFEIINPANTFNLSETEEEDEDLELESDSTSDDTITHVSMEPYEPRKDLSMYHFPIPELLKDYTNVEIDEDAKRKELTENKDRIESTLKSFKIDITKISAIIGPTVTLYEIVPAEGIRISKIKNLENDIALNLAALGIRIIAPIPGKGTIGIEVPNKNPNIVSMKEIITSDKFQNNKYELPIGLGKTISNEPFVVDLAKMPHLLMAGATGQGKSVGLNAIITSLLYKKHPSEMKMVLIDPKKVEFPLYSTIEKHYLAKLPDEEEPIITDTKKVIRTLNSLCIEMDNRYELLKIAKVRNIKEYNAKFCRRELSPTNGHRYLPYIVLIIDEFGDLIMTAGREVEHPLARLAQLARAIGIHLIIATQRPSVKIISGNIKANFPARVAFRVSSRIDSQTILDATGADQLIGKGDMLLSTGSDLLRLQCAFVDTPEVESISNYISDQQSYPEAYLLPEYADKEDDFKNDDRTSTDKIDSCFMDAATLIVQSQQGSTSLIQRRMNLGYNRAGRIMDQLEEFDIVGPSNGSKARDVKVQTLEELRVIFDKMGLL